ncbi:MAG: TIGR03790 family protein [Chthoniobacter sp.]|uniref:TIGR03790 family protein n=1 Tax=Chthoniobacter sp. TaxID=2510640 RepID=UPI0032AE52B9
MKLSPRIAHLLALTFACGLLPMAMAAPKPPRAVAVHSINVPNPYAAATLVVFNETDRDSVELAHFYAEKRGIPKEQVIGLKTAKTEEITRDEYEHTIAEPLRRAFTSNLWWKLRDPESPLGPVESNKIRFVALIRGIPLKIAEAPGYAGDKVVGVGPVATVNAAAVDSELAILGYRMHMISGAVPNTYFRSFSGIFDAHRPELLLVCRLDAPSPEIVRRMITDSLEAEEKGLTGLAYIDARNIKEAGYLEGDTWLYALANSARRHGTPVVLDNGPGLFPESYPMEHAGLYFGWYAEHISGPFVRPDFRFAKGAVAVHIHSFSAATLRDPLHHWVGPLVSAGAAATFGNVYEPYLSLTPQLDVFHDRLRAGFSFAESCYMAQRALSWMTTFVGDPLYRPFKGAAELEEKPTSGEWADFREAGRAWFSVDRAKGDEDLRALGKKDHSGMIMEGLGLLQVSVNDRDGALASFALAREYYGKGEDAMRVAVHEIIQLQGSNRAAEAKALAQKMIAANSHSPAVDLLRTLTESRVAPAPPQAASARH